MRIADLAKELNITETLILNKIKSLKLRSKDGIEITAGVEMILRDALADEGIGQRVDYDELGVMVLRRLSNLLEQRRRITLTAPALEVHQNAVAARPAIHQHSVQIAH